MESNESLDPVGVAAHGVLADALVRADVSLREVGNGELRPGLVLSNGELAQRILGNILRQNVTCVNVSAINPSIILCLLIAQNCYPLGLLCGVNLS